MSAALPKLGDRPRPVTFGSATRAEWVKFVTLISYPLTAFAALVLVAGLGVLSSYSLAWSGASGHTLVQPGQVLDGIQYAQVLIATLMVVFVASEHTQGTIQPTLLAVPTRLLVLGAKAIVAAAVGATVGILGGGVAVGIAPLILNDYGLHLDTTFAKLVGTVGGTGVYLALIAVLALGLAVLLRSLVAAFLTTVALLTVAPILLAAVPIEWVARLTTYLPTVAGVQFLAPEPGTALLDPWLGLGVLALWALVSGVAGGVALRVRDA